MKSGALCVIQGKAPKCFYIFLFFRLTNLLCYDKITSVNLDIQNNSTKISKLEKNFDKEINKNSTQINSLDNRITSEIENVNEDDLKLDIPEFDFGK